MWNVVWQVEVGNRQSSIEEDWFAEIFAAVPVASARTDYSGRPLLEAAPDHALVCVSCPNQTSPADLIAYLQRLPRPRVLYHLSDEYVAVGAAVYDQCDFVIRNGSADFSMAGDPRFMQLPLGYVTGLRNAAGDVVPASRRACSWAFLGTVKNDRATEMLPALATVRGRSFVRQTPFFSAGAKYFGGFTITAYRNSVFVPNPMGNWNPECNRLYDALEWGCIPLIRRYTQSAYHRDYHDRLLGPNPLPTFDSWAEAAAFADRMVADPEGLDRLQATAVAWWRAKKAALAAELAGRLQLVVG